MTAVAEAVARERRIADEEDARWYFLRERLEDGHEAAALSTTNLATLDADVLYDDEVEVIVTVRGSESDEQARYPLGEVWRLPLNGAEIVDVSAPTPRPIMFQALSQISTGPNVFRSAAIDRRGLGFVALSPAPGPTPGRTLGEWVQGYAERSGVRHVNERREAAAAELYRRLGEDEARREIASVRAATMITASVTHAPGWMSQWRILRYPGPVLLSASPRGTPPARLADLIVHELEDVAGTSQAGRRTQLITREFGRESDEEEPTDPTDHFWRNIDDLAPPGLGLTSGFARHQRHGEPTESLALDLVQGGGLERLASIMTDGDVGFHVHRSALDVEKLREILGEGFEVVNGDAGPSYLLIRRPGGEWEQRQRTEHRARIGELLTFGGLTERQAECLAMSELDGISQREIGRRLGVDPAVVSRHIARAKDQLARRFVTDL